MITLAELGKKLGLSASAISWMCMRREFPLPDVLGAKYTGWALTTELEELIGKLAVKHAK